QVGSAAVFVKTVEKVFFQDINDLCYVAVFTGTMRIRFFLHGDDGEEFLCVFDKNRVFFKAEQGHSGHKKSHMQQRCAPYYDARDFDKSKPIDLHGPQNTIFFKYSRFVFTAERRNWFTFGPSALIIG